MDRDHAARGPTLGGLTGQLVDFAGGGLLGRVRMIFFGLFTLNGLAALFALASRRIPGSTKALGLVALVVLMSLLVAGIRRAGFPPGSSVVEAVLLGSYLATSGDVALSLPIFYPALIVRSMYGTARGAWGRSVVYFVGFAVPAVLFVEWPRGQLGPVLSMQFVGFPFIAVVLYSLHRAVAEHEAVARIAAENVVALRELEGMKNTFLSATSHELRTPATVVRGMSELLARSGDQIPEAQRQELLQRLAANATRLSDLLEQLLDVDRLTRGRAEANRREVDLTAVATKVVGGLPLHGRDVHLPSAPFPAHVDPDMVERIVENLVVNAIKYGADGGTIWIHFRRDDGAAVLCVDDDGPGVPPEHRDAIFQPFFRVDDDSPSPGTGVGLALVASFARLHGGRAWVEDREGGGASFRVALEDRHEGT